MIDEPKIGTLTRRGIIKGAQVWRKVEDRLAIYDEELRSEILQFMVHRAIGEMIDGFDRAAVQQYLTTLQDEIISDCVPCIFDAEK